MAQGQVTGQIEFGARISWDDKVDVLYEGEVLPNGAGLSMEEVMKLLIQFAETHGVLRMRTETPSGKIKQDLVYPDGTVVPVVARKRTSSAEAKSDGTELLGVMEAVQKARESGQRVNLARHRPPSQQRHASKRLIIGSDDIPRIDIEAEIQRNQEAEAIRRSLGRGKIVKLGVGVAVLAGGIAGAVVVFA